MTSPFVFSITKCPIDSVTKLPPGGMIADTTIPSPPGSMPACVSQPISPLPQEPPCPDITPTTASVYVGTNAVGGTITVPSFSLSVTKGSCCSFTIGALLELPAIACPTMTSSAATPKVTGYSATPTYNMTVTKNPSACAFDFDMNLTVPCPSVTASNFTAPGKTPTFSDTPKYLLTATKAGTGCAYDLDLSITVPCPTLNGMAMPKVLGFSDTPSYTLSATKSSGCVYDFDLNITAPCPSLTGMGSPVTTTFSDTPTYQLTATKSAGCVYSFGMNLTVPCPSITALVGPPGNSVTYVQPTGNRASGKIKTTVAKTAGCTYTVDTNLTLNMPGIMLVATPATYPGGYTCGTPILGNTVEYSGGTFTNTGGAFLIDSNAKPLARNRTYIGRDAGDYTDGVTTAPLYVVDEPDLYVKTPNTLPGGYDGSTALEGTIIFRRSDDTWIDICNVFIRELNLQPLTANTKYTANWAGSFTQSSVTKMLCLCELGGAGSSSGGYVTSVQCVGNVLRVTY